VLTKEEEFLLSTVDKITDPEAKKEYLDRLHSSMNITTKPNTSYNLKDILNINDLQNKINNKN